MYATTRTDDKNSVNPDIESHDFDSLYDHSQRPTADRSDWNEQLNFDDGDTAPPPWMTMDGNIRDVDGTEIVIAPTSSPAAVAVMPELGLATSSLLANDALAAPGVQTRSHERSRKRKRIHGGAVSRVNITTKMAALEAHVGESSIHPLMRKLLEIDLPTKEILTHAFRFKEVVMLSRLNGLKQKKNGRKLRKVRVYSIVCCDRLLPMFQTAVSNTLKCNLQPEMIDALIDLIRSGQLGTGVAKGPACCPYCQGYTELKQWLSQHGYEGPGVPLHNTLMALVGMPSLHAAQLALTDDVPCLTIAQSIAANAKRRSGNTLVTQRSAVCGSPKITS
jgi:hypothetical protein